MEDQAKYNEGDDEFRKEEYTDEDIHAAARIFQEELGMPIQDALKLAKGNMTETWGNKAYSVSIIKGIKIQGLPELISLTVSHRNGCRVNDQHEIREIIDKLIGAGHEAIELYPAGKMADRDRHLWVISDSSSRFPFRPAFEAITKKGR